MSKILDIYIKRPLLYDLIICTLMYLIIGSTIDHLKYQLDYKADDLKSILYDIITTSISLVGFILASLTIIVTFKDNIARKVKNETSKDTSLNNQLTGLEVLFSSKQYRRIVGVFTGAAFIFLLIFLICELVRLYSVVLPLKVLYRTSICSLLLIALTVFRCLFVLYKVVKLQVNDSQ